MQGLVQMDLRDLKQLQRVYSTHMSLLMTPEMPLISSVVVMHSFSCNDNNVKEMLLRGPLPAA